MKLASGRILSALITAGGWLLTGARIVLDAVGYSTAPEDLGVFTSRAVLLLTAMPWWGYLIFALVSTLWLMRVSWPPAPDAPAAVSEEKPPLQQTKQMREVKGSHIKGQTIVLDWHVYIDCTFEDCNFSYDGGEVRIVNCKRIGKKIGFTTENLAVRTTAEFFRHFVYGGGPIEELTVFDLPKS